MGRIYQFELSSLDGTALVAADNDLLIADYNVALGTVDKTAALLDPHSLGVGVNQWARTITATLTDANSSITECKVYLTGTNVLGATLQETLTFTVAAPAESSYAFASLTSVIVHVDGAVDAGADKLRIGVGSILGLPCTVADLDYIRTKRVDTTIDNGTVDLTYQTWEPEGGNIPDAAKRFYFETLV